MPQSEARLYFTTTGKLQLYYADISCCLFWYIYSSLYFVLNMERIDVELKPISHFHL